MTHRDVSGPPLRPLFRRRPLVGDPLLDDGQFLPREGPERGQAVLRVVLGTAADAVGHGGGAQNGKGGSRGGTLSGAEAEAKAQARGARDTPVVGRGSAADDADSLLCFQLHVECGVWSGVAHRVVVGFPRIYVRTGPPDRMSHRKWRENKQQPS